MVEEEFHPFRQHRRERLHALDGYPFGDLAEHVGEAWVIGGKLLRLLPHRRGQQQLTAGRRPQPGRRDGQAALVCSPEAADFLDRVAPELDPQRVLFCGREHVQDAAPHGDLAAVLHQVRASVPDLDQPGHGGLEVGGLPGTQLDGLQVTEPGDHRLEQASHRGHHRGERAGLRAGRVRVSEPAQHREPLAGGVGTRGEPFMRQRLPGREVGDGLGRKQRAEGIAEFFGLTRSRSHREDEPLRLSRGGGESRGEKRAESRRCDEVGRHPVGLA